MQEKLKEILLLGVDRKPFEISALPDAIKPYIKVDQNDAQKVLLSMAYLTYYNSNGKPLKQSEKLLANEIVSESLPYIDQALCTPLKDIFELSSFLKPRMLKSWLDAMANKNLIVPPDYILELIREGRAINAAYKTIIKKIIGNRGEAILPLMEAKDYLNIKSINVWNEGGSEDRKSYFKELRIDGKEESISVLRSTWAQESI